MVKAESFAYTINGTSGRVIASVWVKCELQNNRVRGISYRLDKNRSLLKEMLKSLTERLCGPL